MVTRIRPWLLKRRRELFIVLGVAGAVALVILLLGPFASWATPAATSLTGKDKADAVNATRQILLATVGGLALLTGAAFTTRTYYLSRRGQLTDRYTKAIALLASDKITERLGGIYALEHLMVESERDHETVIEVLAAYIREQTISAEERDLPWGTEHRHDGGDGRPRKRPRPPTDIQAALTVIGRRPQRQERDDLVDLSEADLCGADLTRLNFSNAWFWRAKLQSAKMAHVRLTGAKLSWAQLQDAGLFEADLRAARLYRAQLQKGMLMGAQLQGTELETANLQGAYLADADFQGATLNGAELQGADLIAYPTGDPASPPRGLTVDQLATAVLDGDTRLPDELRDRLRAMNQAEPNAQTP